MPRASSACALAHPAGGLGAHVPIASEGPLEAKTAQIPDARAKGIRGISAARRVEGAEEDAADRRDERERMISQVVAASACRAELALVDVEVLSPVAIRPGAINAARLPAHGYALAVIASNASVRASANRLSPSGRTLPSEHEALLADAVGLTFWSS